MNLLTIIVGLITVVFSVFAFTHSSMPFWGVEHTITFSILTGIGAALVIAGGRRVLHTNR